MSEFHKEVNEDEETLEAPGLYIPYQSLSAEALRGIIEEFISREGTDYGTENFSFEQKCQQVSELIRTGKAVIAFDNENETVSIISAKTPV